MYLELTMALVNSYEDTMDQEHFALSYEFFSCYKLTKEGYTPRCEIKDPRNINKAM